MKEKEIKKEVKLLAKQGQFEQIYHEYGPRYFRKYVSRNYKKKDLRKLKNEGKYFDIYEKYGEKYLDYLTIYAKDVRNEAGWKKSIIYKYREKLKKAIYYGLVSILSLGIGHDITKLYNSQKYSKEIDEYKQKIKEYCKMFNIHTQSDMEIIMRVMKNMHETIRGVGEPEIDAMGYRGMDVMDENSMGVCRNMAENVADKLNEIYPEYNARVFALYRKGGDLESANIERRLIKGNEIISMNGNVQKHYIDGILKKEIITKKDTIIIREYDENEKILEEKTQNKTYDKEENGIFEEIQAKVGTNHAMVAVDLRDDVTLLIDPTNAALGVYKDGKIMIFNEMRASEAIYDRKLLGEEREFSGIEGLLRYPIDYIKSFKEPTLSMEELEKKYGVEAQNEMLKKIEEEDRRKEQSNSFKEDLKVDNKGVAYNFSTNTATITPSNIKPKEETQKEY